METVEQIAVIKRVVAQCKEKMSVDPSFAIAMANYCNHQGVDTLDEPELEQVLGTIAEEAISIASQQGDGTLDGSDFTSTLIYSYGCPHGMGNCHNAASRILGRPVLEKIFIPEDIRHLPSLEENAVIIDETGLNAISNYSRHYGIRELDNSERMRVLDTLAVEAMKGSENIVDGRAVTDTLIIRYGCSKGMGECQNAAAKILGKSIHVDLGAGFDDGDFILET